MRMGRGLSADVSLNYLGYFAQPSSESFGERVSRHYRPRHAAPPLLVRALVRGSGWLRRGMLLA
jgi:hypothetical protein